MAAKYSMARPALQEDINGRAIEGKADHKGPIHGCIRETVAGTTSSSYKAMAGKLPPYSRVTAVQVKCAVAGTISTGTHLGLGTGSAGDPDILAEITFTGIDAVGDTYMAVPDTALFSGATSQIISVASLNGSGAAAGDITAGTWDIAIWYETFPIFDTAS